MSKKKEEKTITTDGMSDGKLNPEQAPGKLGEEEHQRIKLPKVEEAKVEIVKVALATILDDPDVLNEESDKALTSLHHRLHQLWDAAKAGSLKVGKPGFIRVHSLVVEEMEAREIEHNAHDDLDETLRRKRSRIFSGEGYDEGYYKGQSAIDLAFVSDFSEVAKAFPDTIIGKVLEVGCGMGRALKILRAGGVETDGVEVSRYAAGECRKAGFEVALSNAEELPFLDGLYDITFSMDVMEHCEDLEKAIRESLRVSRLKAVHLIPLGIRCDATHKHVFKTFTDLRDRLVALNLGCGLEVHRTPSNKAVVILDKEATDVTPITASLQDFVIVKDFLSLAGGAIKSEEADDIDLVWRLSEPLAGCHIALRNLLPESVRERVHHIWNPQGPHDDHMPLYDLVAVKRAPFRKVNVQKADRALKPNARFVPLKTASGYTQQEFFTPEAFYDRWAKPFIEEGTRLAVEQKFNGYRTIAQYDGKDTLVYFEDSKTDRSKQLAPIVSDLKAIGKPVILDMDLGAVYANGDPIPRVELSGLISTNTVVGEDGKFKAPSGREAMLTPHVFHLLYADGKDLHTLPWQDMRKKLDALFRSHDFRFLKESKPKLVSSKADLIAQVKRVSKLPGSEGAVVKVVTSDYPLTGQSTGWAKVKNVLEIKVEAIDRKPVKGASRTWNYVVGFRDQNGKLREMGKTFNTKVNAKPGDILTLSAEEVIPKRDEDAKTWIVTTVVPRVEDLETGSVKAEGVESIIRRAYEANVLQATPDTLSELKRAKILKAAIEVPEIIIKVEGSVSFKEGDKGTGILQTHERGLSESQVKLTHDFGWEPVTFTESDLRTLSNLVGKNVSSLYQEAQEGSSIALGEALAKVDVSQLSKSQRELIARAMPVSIHTDFRLRPGKETYWEGGEAFSPGNQFQPNRLRLMAEDKLPAGSKVLMNFKVGRVPEEGKEPTEKADKPVKGPIAWMTIGDKTPDVFPPGAVGSTPDSYSRFLIRDRFNWIAGVQDEHYKEFLFDGDVLKGRYIFQFVPVGRGENTEQAEGRAWMLSKPKKQTFDSEALNKRAEIVLPILKRDDEKHIVMGVVLKPDETDAQGDIVSADEIEKAAHAFMLRYRKGSRIGLMHRDMKRQLEVVESYIAPLEIVINGHVIPKGAWVLAVKVLDDSVWKAVKDGKLTGFSIGGYAKVRPLAS